MTINATQQLKAADNLMALWQGLLPGYEAPPRSQFAMWAGMVSESDCAYALNRAARKALKQALAGQPLDSERIARYLSGIILNERAGRHKFNASSTAPVSSNSNLATP